MAIIKCPECEEPVSSTTNQCVHCGYKFTVCPECGKIEQGEISVCKNCGYEIKKNFISQNRTVFGNKEFDTSEYLDGSLLTAYYSVSKSARNVKNLRKFIMLISFLVGTALLIIAGIDFIQWEPRSVIENVNQVSIVDKINTLCVLSMIFFAIALLYDWFSLYGLIFGFGKWMKDKKVDYISYIKYNSEKTDLDKTVNGYDMTAQASCVAYSKNMQNFVITRLIIITFTLFFSALFFCKALNVNVQACITYKIQSEIIFNFIEVKL